MKVVSDLELAQYLVVSRNYVPEDKLDALATTVAAWLDDIEAGDLPRLAASRQALVQELERLGAGVQDRATRELGASPAETGAVQQESPRPDPELIRRLREQYAQQRRDD